jgi:GTP-binding nuclear protein Ran
VVLFVSQGETLQSEKQIKNVFLTNSNLFSNSNFFSNMEHHVFKLVLIGDEGVGKTSFVRRHESGEFVRQHVPTIGVDVTPLMFNISANETITFTVWDTAGQEKFSDFRNGYLSGIDCAIAMFDTHSRESFYNAITQSKHVKETYRLDPREYFNNKDIPFVICGNKVDVPGRKIKASDVATRCELTNYDYCDLSVKSNFNFEKPFLMLARKLLNNPTLEFVSIA